MTLDTRSPRELAFLPSNFNFNNVTPGFWSITLYSTLNIETITKVSNSKNFS